MPASRPRRRITAVLLVLAATVVAALLYLGHIGYPDGIVFRFVPATAAPAPADRGTVAVFLSSDMGFTDGMGPRIAEGLAAHGIPVVGVSSLAAFSHRRTPAEASRLLRTAIARALALPGARRVVLVGQSFGAGVLAGHAGALPPAMRARIPLVAMVVPPASLLLKATPGGFLDTGDDGPALPAARTIDWAPVLCVYGQDEADSLCSIWHEPNVWTMALPGDHYLRDDDAAIVRALVEAIALTAHDGKFTPR